ncbi:MAG TPA: hypothetical protein VEK08_15055 [Planctomycetota bacterium]|nr:hypothetical protein [Planctomycetota bacterium]
MKRFHLSTLLLLTVLASAFVGANVVWQEERLSVIKAICWRGWPWTYEIIWRVYPQMASVDDWLDTSALTKNIASGLAALALAGYVSEKIARRKR